jgi:hypothetical protein
MSKRPIGRSNTSADVLDDPIITLVSLSIRRRRSGGATANQLDDWRTKHPSLTASSEARSGGA